MAYITTITVSNDNDPSCRTFTLSEEFNSDRSTRRNTINFYRDNTVVEGEEVMDHIELNSTTSVELLPED